MKLEDLFYRRHYLGWTEGEAHVRVASQAEVLMELWCDAETYEKAEPLMDRLQRRTLRRHQYETLVAVMTANSLKTGQVDETEALMKLIAGMWRACPARWVPDLRPLRRWVKARLAPPEQEPDQE